MKKFYFNQKGKKERKIHFVENKIDTFKKYFFNISMTSSLDERVIFLLSQKITADIVQFLISVYSELSFSSKQTLNKLPNFNPELHLFPGCFVIRSMSIH